MSRKSKVTFDSPGVWDRIRQVLGTSNAPEIARKFGITKQSVYERQRGNLPRLNTLADIAEENGISLHWLITGKGPKQLLDEENKGSSKAVFIVFNEADRQLAQELAENEGRTLPEQVDRLVAEALIARGLIPNKYEVLAPILQMLDELSIAERKDFAKTLRDSVKRRK
jgi:transcriptional regulator with XRE-family HTH domain